ncbi:MAG: PIN domain-containing protein [Nanoarchaeota archaeon]|nr:PIN domain-containing protein [Nanoarchaeota archaeon]
MAEKYYLDSCIWRDYFENRSDKFRPLGDWAFSLIKLIIQENNLVIYSDLVEEELYEGFSEEDIKKVISIVPKENLVKIESSSEQLKEAIQIAKKLKIPVKDTLHAILARDNDAIMVTRDKHFYELSEKVTIKKPEDLI